MIGKILLSGFIVFLIGIFLIWLFHKKKKRIIKTIRILDISEPNRDTIYNSIDIEVKINDKLTYIVNCPKYCIKNMLALIK